MFCAEQKGKVVSGAKNSNVNTCKLTDESLTRTNVLILMLYAEQNGGEEQQRERQQINWPEPVFWFWYFAPKTKERSCQMRRAATWTPAKITSVTNQNQYSGFTYHRCLAPNKNPILRFSFFSSSFFCSFFLPFFFMPYVVVFHNKVHFFLPKNTSCVWSTRAIYLIRPLFL